MFLLSYLFGLSDLIYLSLLLYNPKNTHDLTIIYLKKKTIHGLLIYLKPKNVQTEQSQNFFNSLNMFIYLSIYLSIRDVEDLETDNDDDEGISDISTQDTIINPSDGNSR